MENYLQLQNELSLVWASRMQQIADIDETGKSIKLLKPMYQVLNFSQRNYKTLVNDMRKRLRLVRRQMNSLQNEMNALMSFD